MLSHTLSGLPSQLHLHNWPITSSTCESNKKLYIFCQSRYRLASGDVFGDKQLSLCLLDTPTHSNELSGVAMEIIDMASPVIESVHYTSSAKVS